MQRIGAAAQIVRHGPGEIRLPVAIAQIVGVEMDRAVVVRRMTPALLAPAPARADHRARRHVHQPAVARVRTDVVDRLGVDAVRKIPACQQVAGKRLQRRADIGPGRDEAAQDRGILELAGEMMVRRRRSSPPRTAPCRRTARRAPDATASAVTGAPSSGCWPTSTRPLAGSTASHTRYQRAACIAVPVASSVVAPADVIRAVAPFAPISSATPVSPASSASSTCPASTTPGRTSTVQVQADPASRAGPASTMPYEP